MDDDLVGNGRRRRRHRRTKARRRHRLLTTLPQLDEFRKTNFLNVTRTEGNNIDVVHLQLVPGQSDDIGIFINDDEEDDEEADDGNRNATSSSSSSSSSFGICHISGILPFTQGYEGPPGLPAYESAAAIALALHHLNVGDGSIIPQLDGLPKRCNIRFTVEFSDTAYSAPQALDTVLQQMSRPLVVGANGEKPRPCAFVGAYRSAISQPTSILTGLRQYVQVSSSSTSETLDDNEQHPLFARTVPSDYGTALLIIRYYRDVLRVNHLAIVNVNDSYGNSFSEGLRIAAETLAPGMEIIQIPLDFGGRGVRDAIERVKLTKFRYIFGIVFTRNVHDELMAEAYKEGVAGTGVHNWMFGDSFGDVGLERRILKKDSPLALAYEGTGMIVVSGGRSGQDGYDMFNTKIREMKNTDALDYFASIVPKSGDDDDDDVDATPPFVYDEDFLDPPKDAFPTFSYEAAALIGLAACDAASTSLSLSGQDHYDAMLSLNMTGVLNDVVLTEYGSRKADETFYTVTNFFYQEEENGDNVKFQAAIASGFEEGTWQQYTDYVFNDGTSNVQADLPSLTVDMKFISTGVRGTVLELCGVAVVLSIGFGLWTYIKIDARVVRASQPLFLYLICVGACIASCSIITLSLDHAVASLDGMNIACNSTVWLVSIGFAMIFSAFFSKTYRINQIIRSAKRFKRIKIDRIDALKPLVILLSADILILSLMSALSPIQFEVRVIDYDEFGRPSEFLGQCQYNDQIGYLSALLGLNIVIIFLAVGQAWHALHLTSEFAESKWIFRALSLNVVILFVGIPVLFIAYDNPDSNVFVVSAMIFIAVSSVLLLIFVPKIQYEKADQQKGRQSRTRISGIESASTFSHRPSFDAGNLDGKQQSEMAGEKIITLKTAQELAGELEQMQRLLTAQRRINEDAVDRQTRNSCQPFDHGEFRAQNRSVEFALDDGYIESEDDSVLNDLDNNDDTNDINGVPNGGVDDHDFESAGNTKSQSQFATQQGK